MDQLLDYLITDRTRADAERARHLTSLWGPAPGQWRGTEEERAEWEAGLKGAYNAKDLNRVTLAASYLLTKLKEAGYRVPEDAVRLESWTTRDIPSPAEMEAYLAPIRAAREAFPGVSGFPELPETMDHFTFETANDLERVLVIVHGTLMALNKSRVYSGELQGGSF